MQTYNSDPRGPRSPPQDSAGYGNMAQQASTPKPRDFVDVMWQIAEKRSCDEVVIRYDCGHYIRAEVCVPDLPKTREYTNQEADRRRFMQHSIFVLTKNPGSPKVQIAVPEGRCRCCGRGQRQVLVCGPLQMDLTEERQASAQRSSLTDPARGGKAGGSRGVALAASALAQEHHSALGPRRLEMSFSSHVFLAAMGQVCRLPDNITPPPMLQNNSVLQGGALKPFDGPPPREALHQWSRKEIEDELKTEVVKYVGGAMFLLLFIVIECLYLGIVHFGPSSQTGDGAEATADGAGSGNVSRVESGELENLSSISSIEMGMANSTWVLSALTLSVHKAFGPTKDAKGVSNASFWWTAIVHPLWIVTSVVLAPLLWVVDFVMALPRYLFQHVVWALARSIVWRPCSWIFGVTVEIVNNSAIVIFRCFLSRPTAMLSQIPMTNPMVVAMGLSLLVAALSAPQPPSLPLPNVWGDLPSFEITRNIRRAVSKSRVLGPLVQKVRVLVAARKEGRNKGGTRGGPPAGTRGQRGSDKAGAERSNREGKDGPGGKPDRLQAGRQDGKVPGASSSQPACFLCLDRPSRYILEPCGHRVVCGECAVQLVEAAARNRALNEGGSSHHGASEKSGGNCPSCSQAISRAMRVFS